MILGIASCVLIGLLIVAANDEAHAGERIAVAAFCAFVPSFPVAALGYALRTKGRAKQRERELELEREALLQQQQSASPMVSPDQVTANVLPMPDGSPPMQPSAQPTASGPTPYEATTISKDYADIQSSMLVHDRYRVVRQIGKGGMGAVYEAIDERLAQTVALKQMTVSGENLDKAFEREARILARLRHPALARVIDYFKGSNGQFLVMDFIAGEDLSSLLIQRNAPFEVQTVLDWADQILDALAYLHAEDPPIIHRDIKPQNLKLTTNGRIVLLDFGLAKGTAALQTRVTSTGRSVFGYTPQYAPLEQIQGTGTDPRSDLYSLAATLHHLLTNDPPSSALTRTAAVMDEQPDPLRPVHERNPAVPVAVSEVLQQALALQARKRPESAAAMRANLRTAR